MSREEDSETPDGRDPESFLERWSRRKQEARGAEPADGPEPSTRAGQSARPAPVAAADLAPPAVPLPDIEQLNQDSDFRAFLAPGVAPELRRRALRKLFRGPKFNVLDGLDIYQDDFRSFEPLGSVVTADMRHQLEAAARRIAASMENEGPGVPTAAAATDAAARTPADETDGTAATPAEVDDDEQQRDA